MNLVANNDNKGRSVQEVLNSIARKREIARKRFARQDTDPLSFEEKVLLKNGLATLAEVENDILNRVYGINQKLPNTVNKNKLHAFQNLKSELNSNQ